MAKILTLGMLKPDAIASGNPNYVWDVLSHAVLPALTLGLLAAGIFLRLVRTNVIGTYNRDKRWGSVNSGRYSNAALDALTDKALATIDDVQREAILRQAVKMAMDDVAIIPVQQLTNFWAMRRGFGYEPRMDERTLAFRVSPAN